MQKANLCHVVRQILQLIDKFGHELVMFCRERRNTIPDLIDLNKFMIKFDDILKKQYLLGDLISYPDFALIPHILQICAFESLVFPFSMLTKHPNLLNWLNLMMTRSSVKSTSQNHAKFFIEHLQHRGFFSQFTTKFNTLIKTRWATKAHLVIIEMLFNG